MGRACSTKGGEDKCIYDICLFWCFCSVTIGKHECSLYLPHNAYINVVVLKSSLARSKNKCWFNLLNFGCHLLQNSLLGNVYSDSIIFLFMLQKHRGSNFPQCCRVPLVIPFGCQTLFQNVVPSVFVDLDLSFDNCGSRCKGWLGPPLTHHSITYTAGKGIWDETMKINNV
jgi:hypothetical protein